MRAVRLLLSLLACSFAASVTASERLETLLKDHRNQWAPDARTAVVRFSADVRNNRVHLTGETDIPAAKTDLIARLESAGYRVNDASHLLPDVATLGQRQWGLVRVPVAPLSAKPAFTASQDSQALMGTPVRLLSRHNGWYRVQLPDGYIGWMRRAQITPLTTDALAEHNRSRRLVVTALEGALVTSDAHTICRLSMGSIVRLVSDTPVNAVVALPDGRIGRIKSDTLEPLDDFLRRTQRAKTAGTVAHDVVAHARKLIGQPYLWGGASAAGMDCSGFVQLTYRLSDYWLPRDASQMAYTRAKSSRLTDPFKAAPGDLLFFGIKAKDGRPERIQHVGLSLGGGRMIHSLDDVHVASLNPTDPSYDAYEAGRFLFALPMPLGEGNACASSLADNGFYQSPPRRLTPCRPFGTP